MRARERVRTVPAAAGSRGCCTFGSPARCGTTRACTCACSCARRERRRAHEKETEHALLPHQVPTETKHRDEQEHKVKHGVGPEPRDQPLILEGKPDGGSDDGVQGQEEHGEREGARDRCDRTR